MKSTGTAAELANHDLDTTLVDLTDAYTPGATTGVAKPILDPSAVKALLATSKALDEAAVSLSNAAGSLVYATRLLFPDVE